MLVIKYLLHKEIINIQPSDTNTFLCEFQFCEISFCAWQDGMLHLYGNRITHTYIYRERERDCSKILLI